MAHVLYVASGVGKEPSPEITMGMLLSPEKQPAKIRDWSRVKLYLTDCMYDSPMASIMHHLHCLHSIFKLQRVKEKM